MEGVNLINSEQFRIIHRKGVQAGLPLRRADLFSRATRAVSISMAIWIFDENEFATKKASRNSRGLDCLGSPGRI